MRGRPKAALVLSGAEREQLIALTMRRKTAQALALRARIVLACAEGIDNQIVAINQRVTSHTVSKWRSRFIQHRLDGLLDEPRPGAPRRIGDEQVERSSHARSSPCRRGDALEHAHDGPRNGAVADRGDAYLACLWLAAASAETFKLSTDPLFIEKVRDIVGLYLNPPDRPWCCAWTRRVRFRRWIARSRFCR